MKYAHVLHEDLDDQQPTNNGYIFMYFMKYVHVLHKDVAQQQIVTTSSCVT